jgi:hypothetical protein
MSVQERITKLKELDAKIIDVMLGDVDASVLASYSQSNADGSQSASRRSPKELWDWHKAVAKEIAELQRRGQSGIRTFGTNRYGGGL